MAIEALHEVVVEAAEAAPTEESPVVEKVLIDPICLVAVHTAALGGCLDADEIAEEIGAKPETVERCLEALADLGLVAKGPRNRYCHCKAVAEMSEKLKGYKA